MADEQATEAPIEIDAAAEGGTVDAPIELHALLEDARSKVDEHWNQCLRLQAELDNQHKRGQRDLENAHKYGLEKFASALLPVRDSLEMGIAAATQGQSIDPAKLIEGSELTLKMLAGVLEKFGVTELNPQGERFDPQFHEAMSIQPRGDVEANTVVAVVQKGYLLNDRLVRPAMVIVSKAAPGTESNAGPSVDVRA